MCDSSHTQRNHFSFNSMKSKTCEDKHMRETCFQHFCGSDSNGLTFETFVKLLENLFVNSEGVSYHLPYLWKTEWFELFDVNSDQTIDFNEFELMWNNWIQVILQPKCALIIIDVQNDFISGSLALNQCPAGHKGEDVIPVINGIVESVPFIKVVYTQDWHPSDHISFFDNKDIRRIKSETDSQNEIKPYDTVIFEGPPQMEQRLWPTHCVQQTWGSRIHSDLKICENSIRILKGTNSLIDSYSAFWDNQRLSQTDLNRHLQNLGITDVYLCGIATDFCVGFSAMDAIDCGYRTVIIEDASRGISPQEIDRIKQTLTANKAIFVDSFQVMDLVKGRDRRPELAFALTLKIKSNKTSTDFTLN